MICLNYYFVQIVVCKTIAIYILFFFSHFTVLLVLSFTAMPNAQGGKGVVLSPIELN